MSDALSSLEIMDYKGFTLCIFLCMNFTRDFKKYSFFFYSPSPSYLNNLEPEFSPNTVRNLETSSSGSSLLEV